MAYQPTYGDATAEEVADELSATEITLLALLAAYLAPDPTTPVTSTVDAAAWATARLARLAAFKKRTRTILSGLDSRMRYLITFSVNTAYREGSAAALLDLPDGSRVRDTTVSAREALTEALDRIAPVYPQVQKTLDTVYRKTVADVVANAAPGADLTVLVQQALDRFAAQGITGFVDKNGRHYNLVSYVEMAVRFAVSEAELDAYIGQVQAAGLDLVIVSDVPQACPLCTPFEGEILSLTGKTVGAIEVDDNGNRFRVKVLCSYAESRARGLWHPGCRHTLSAFYPTRMAPPTATPPDPAGYAATQRTRALQRQIRAATRHKAVAITQLAKRKAQQRLAQRTAAYRQHTRTR